MVLLAIPAAMLAGCGESRDEALAEKVARAEHAAAKAEEAQHAAERAARAAGARLNEANASKDDAGGSVPVGDEHSDAPVDTANASAEQNTNLASALGVPAS
jgi:hypothetical protein